LGSSSRQFVEEAVIWFLALSLTARVAILFVAGLFLAGAINWGIYRLAYDVRWISPWSAAPIESGRRTWLDRAPLVGWFRLRRETPLHGPNFWVRPLAVELLTGFLLAFLYWWEIGQWALLPTELQAWLRLPNHQVERAAALIAMHWEYLAHVLLLALMLVASFIDLDEKTIPDAVTIPGTLLGLALAVAAPQSLLPIMSVLGGPNGMAAAAPARETLLFCSPNDWPWPIELAGGRDWHSLAVGLACIWLWCVALLPRIWRGRRGVQFALWLFCARLRSEPVSKWIVTMGIALSGATFGVWKWAGLEHWQALLTALVGMTISGGLIWVVRVVGALILGREAMGFGDVTLMAMIGAFLGWQPCLVVFFLAPFAGAVIGVLQWLSRRDPEIRYGPFLCLAALVVIVRWAAVWQSTAALFAVNWLVLAMLGGALALLGPLLYLVRAIGDRLRGR
jgi:prepilin signal peptidase PulO-like enzyme (type II secretory pathway)